MQLQGKTALIAGAGRNMGKAIALTFAREGADLILVARTGDDVKQVAKECEALGVQALAISADVSTHNEVNRVVQLGLERFGKVDVLVNSAALRPHVDFWEYGYDVWQQVFAVNVHSTFWLAKALAPSMIKRKTGSIISFGSGSAMSPRPRGTLESACKHSLYGLIKALALDLGPHGVRANLLVVGHMDTERRNPEWYPDGLEADNPAIKNLGLGRSGTNQEVANVALFLASEQSSYVTGASILCMGGRYM